MIIQQMNMKPTQTDVMPRLRKIAQASRTSCSSSGVSISPVGGRTRSVTAIGCGA